MDALLKIQEVLVNQHILSQGAGGLVTKVARSASGCVAYRKEKPTPFFLLALVDCFFRFSFGFGLARSIVLSGHKGPSALFNATTLYENAFVLHAVVYVLVAYCPKDFVFIGLKHKYVAPLLKGVCVVNQAACAVAAMDGSKGMPFALFCGYIVWCADYFLLSEAITLETLITASLTLLPYAGYEQLKGPLKQVGVSAQADFLVVLLWAQLAMVLIEGYAKVSVVGKLSALYSKIPAVNLKVPKFLKKFTSKFAKSASAAVKRSSSPAPKSPRGKKTR